MDTVAQLDEVACGQQANGRNAPCLGGGFLDDTAGTGSEQSAVGQIMQTLDRGMDIEGGILNRRHDQFAAGFQARSGHLLMPGANDHFIYAADRSLARFAETTGHTGEILQFERNVLKNMSRPGTFFKPAQKSAAFAVTATVLDQRGQKPVETIDESGQGVRWVILQFPDINNGFDDRAVGPDVGSAQVANLQKLDVFRFHVLDVGIRKSESMG